MCHIICKNISFIYKIILVHCKLAIERNRVGINQVLLSSFLEVRINCPEFLKVFGPFSYRESCPFVLIGAYVVTVLCPQNVEPCILRTKR